MTDAPHPGGPPANPIPMRVGMTAPEAFPAAEMAEAAGRAILDIGKDFAFYPGDLGHPACARCSPGGKRIAKAWSSTPTRSR